MKKNPSLHDSNAMTPLPMTRKEMKARRWDAIDILLISGDAYVDHPSFGTALLARVLEKEGFRVGIIAQPRWTTPDDFTVMGRPRLFAGITAGAVDSMLAHYTAFRKLRRHDAYTPRNVHGKRPNRASLVYTSMIRNAFPGLPVVLGGIEASMRRASHYDFWTDKIRRSILLDSKADLLVCGMGERAIVDIAHRLNGSDPYEKELLWGIPGTAFACSSQTDMSLYPYFPDPEHLEELPSHEAILEDAAALMGATLTIEKHSRQQGQWLIQKAGNQQVFFTSPALPLTTPELDALYSLPFTRRPHPHYKAPIPAAEMIQFSITAHRGCAAACTFCALTQHQGRQIQSRSTQSIVDEMNEFLKHPDWKGVISDLGGPTANMWGARCLSEPSECRREDCLFPRHCPHFKIDDESLVQLLHEVAAIQGVKHLRISSGIRYDLTDERHTFLRELIHEFVGGQLKVAPEHLCDPVLRLMRKPSMKVFEQFLHFFEEESRKAGKTQFLVPYLISAFPGCTDGDMKMLAEWLEKRNWRPRQVQCFIPTPGTVATAMFYAKIDTHGKRIYVATSDKQRMRQHHRLIPEETGDSGNRNPRSR